MNEWYAVYTRSKGEKIAKQYFEKNSITAYVPTLRKTKKYTRKIKHYDIPLINCYCFVNIHANQRIEVLKNPYAIRFLTIGGEMQPIPEREINVLKRVTGVFNEIEVHHANHFRLGEEVEVASGQLAGLKGFIAQIDGKKDLIIELTHIGFQLRLHVNPSHLRKIKTIVA